VDAGVVKQCLWVANVGKCQQWGALACQVSTPKPPPPSPPPPPPAAFVSGVACSTLTPLPAGEPCNLDWTHRNAVDCPKYSFVDAGVVKQCWWDRSVNKCQNWGAQACQVVTRSPSASPPPPSPAAGTLLCSTLAATRINTRELDPPNWCGSDPKNRNSITKCAQFYSVSNGGLRTCEYAGGKCTMAAGTTCVEDRMFCSDLVATRTNVRDLDPPVWCNAPAHRNPTTCATLYGPVEIGSAELSPCIYNAADNSCRMQLGHVCVEDRV
jgi:hypothetical protein